MTKFMPVRKMQIYFLSVAWYKKALEGLHLHLLLDWGVGEESGGLGGGGSSAMLGWQEDMINAV